MKYKIMVTGEKIANRIIRGLFKGGLIISSIGLLMAIVLCEIRNGPQGDILYFAMAILLFAVWVELLNKEV